MKQITSKTAIAIALLAAVAACSKEAPMFGHSDGDNLYRSTRDVENGLTGAYNALSAYQFLGRNVIALGDFAADLAVADPSTGHFMDVNAYLISEETDELRDIWAYGYKVIDRCVRTTAAAKAMLPSASHTDSLALQSALYQAYGLRALTNLYLVNIFALPYADGQPNDGPGIVVVDEQPVQPFQKVSRATVAKVYDHIDQCIERAHAHLGEHKRLGGSALGPFYITEPGLLGIEARAHLYRANYAEAARCAAEAIALCGSPVGNEVYAAMWSTTATTAEDVFSLAKSEADNLSANSLNNLYQSYLGWVGDTVYSLLAPTDIRLALILDDPDWLLVKWAGLPSSQNTSNVHIIRLSELYLIQAEAEAQLGNLSEAAEALLPVAQRDSAIASAADLPSTQAELLDFIEQERVRELYAEGHRWFDLRRTARPFMFNGAPFNVAQFCYPIPADEVNSGSGVEQTPNWAAALP